jgi:hypothetical protein
MLGMGSGAQLAAGVRCSLETYVLSSLPFIFLFLGNFKALIILKLHPY